MAAIFYNYFQIYAVPQLLKSCILQPIYSVFKFHFTFSHFYYSNLITIIKTIHIVHNNTFTFLCCHNIETYPTMKSCNISSSLMSPLFRIYLNIFNSFSFDKSILARKLSGITLQRFPSIPPLPPVICTIP